MAKGRMINKRIAKSDKLAALPRDRSRALYFMIYPHLDCEGRYSGDPRDIKEDCCPRIPWSIKQVVESLQDLYEVGLIVLYEVDGKKCLEVSRFEDFNVSQKEREAPSIIPQNPNPNNINNLIENSGVGQEDSGVDQAKSLLKLNLKLNLNLNKDIYVNQWNEFAEKYSLPKIEDIEKGSIRESHLISRMKKKNFSFPLLLEKIEKQSFLLGENKDGWKIGLDWILKASNYQKIMEETYIRKNKASVLDEWAKETQEKIDRGETKNDER